MPTAFNAHQGEFGSKWLNVVHCKILGPKLDDQQLRISMGLRLGAKVSVALTCHRGESVEWDRLDGLSCTKSAGRFSPHACYSQFSHKADVGISRLSFNARTAWTVTN